jgi:apolipoprotein N-acyltransferase
VPRWLDRVRTLARAGQTEWLSLLIGPTVLAAAIILGAFSMKYVALPEPDAARQPMIRVVQPNIGQQDKHKPAYERVNFAKLVSLTGKPGPVPRLILWPEAAIPDYLEEEEWARERLAALIGPNDMIMTGGVALIYNDDGELTGARNAMFTLNPDAEIIARYEKAHLVPYGEYLPMKPILSLIGLTRLVPGTVDFIPGPGPQSLTVPGFGKVGIQICYEIIFSGNVVDNANRPDFLFNPSNDAWFGAWGPPQHLAQARLRAIEEGISVVRATPTGISAIIDPNGRIRHALPYQKPGFIEARVPRSHAPTLFAQHGNILPLGLSLLLIALGFALRTKRR